MTNKYPRIKELGLKTSAWQIQDKDMVYADDLERILESGHEVFGNNNSFNWISTINDYVNRKGLVINIQPYVKPDPKEEKLKELEDKVQGLLKEIQELK